MPICGIKNCDCDRDTEYEINDMIMYRPSFGTATPTKAKIVGVGEKNDRVVYDLDNNHWCYEDQIDSRI